jgi:hypothetical protein
LRLKFEIEHQGDGGICAADPVEKDTRMLDVAIAG